MQPFQLGLFESAAPAAPLSGRLEETVQDIFTRVCRQHAIRRRRRTRLSASHSVEIHFRPWANANSRIHLSPGALRVVLSDFWQTAPPEVVEALAEILISKIERVEPHREFRSQYQLWINSAPVAERLTRLKRERGRKRIGSPAGEVYDLVEIFDRLNREFFGGRIPTPQLGWSLTRSQTQLGHYDPPHHTIVLNPILDSPSVPAFVTEFIVFHEMLHIEHPVEFKDARRRVHTRAFRESERRFPQYAEAKRFIRQMSLQEY